MCRRPLRLAALLLLAACVGEPAPTGPDVSDPDFVLIDGSTSGNSHFYFLPPLIAGQPSTDGVFDPTLRPRVEICQWSTTDQACATDGPVFTYTTTSGPGGEVVTVDDDHYRVHFDTELPGIEPEMVFRARVFIVNLELGSVDLELGATGQDVRSINSGENIGLMDGRTLPLQFRIEEGAVAEEETQAEADCFDELGNVVDCDVEVIEGDEGGTTTVFEDPDGEEETLAAIVTIAPDDVVDGNGDPVDDFVLTLQHVREEPAPVQDIPLEQQIPFFVDVTAEDSEGQPVFFVDGATLTLCQPPDLGDANADVFIPDELHQFLVLFQVGTGGTQILPTTLDNGANCPSGLHGGLNTVGIGSFSGFGATLPTLPSASTAVVPDGTVDQPTVIDIQAKLDSDNDQIFDGDEVVVTVSGANTASAAVTDDGDGTYTAEYTPSAAGTDNIEIEIRNVVTGDLEPISGSPFTSVVANPGATIDDVDLSSTSLVIGGPLVSYTATITNTTASTISTAVLQATVDQGSASRAAGGLQVTCGSGAGNLPPGTCTLSFSINASNSTAGVGTLVSGAATARFELEENSTVLSTFTVPVTLVVPGSWASTGAMSAPRRDHTSTVLNDGRVLMVGGTGADAEIFDPATGVFTTLTTVFGHGQGVSATRLADGRVLVVSASGAETFDPTSGGVFTATGSPNQGRTYHSATLLPSGEVLIAGGQISVSGGSQTISSAELYDPVSGSFTTIAATLGDDRTGHSATLLASGDVLLVGGLQTTTPGSGVCLNSAEIYDPGAGTFTGTGGLPTGRCGLGLTTSPLLASGEVLVVGGSDSTAQLYDPVAGTFSSTGIMASLHISGTATLLSDGRVLVAGGFVATGPVTTASVEVYDPATGLFTPEPDMSTPRQQHAAALLSDGRILVSGGFDGAADVSTAEVYTPGS